MSRELKDLYPECREFVKAIDAGRILVHDCQGVFFFALPGKDAVCPNCGYSIE
jgi:hypothetical protein